VTGQLLVVGNQTIVHVDQRRSHVPVRGVSVIRGQLLVLLVRGGIDGDRRLLEFGGELRGLDHLQQPHLRRRKENLKFFDVGIPSPLLILRQNPLGILFVIR
jgi:hypothetical protein